MFGLGKLRKCLDILVRELDIRESANSFYLQNVARPGEILPEFTSVRLRGLAERLDGLEAKIQEFPASYVIDPGKVDYIVGMGHVTLGRKVIPIAELLRLLVEHTGMKLIEVPEVPLKPRHYELESSPVQAESGSSDKDKPEIKIERTY